MTLSLDTGQGLQAPPNPSPGPAAPIRILHLEDRSPDALLVQHWIEAARPAFPAVFQVVATKEAFENALKEGCSDVILCDYQVPGYGGEEALAAAKALLPDVPFIMVTGELGEDRAIEVLKTGATDYVLKDNLRRLVPAMRRALRDAELLREHRKAEKALRRSERIYRAIGETIDYGIWICDPEGRNTYTSQSLLDLVGMTQEECSAFGWGNFLHPDDAAGTIAAWQECVRNGTHWEREHRFKGKDGRYHHILARGIPIRDDLGNILCWAGINLDIDDIKRTEWALRNSEKRLQDLIRLAPTFIYEIDFHGPRFTSVNEAMCAFTGYSREELLATNPMDLLTPESQAAFRERIAQWLRGERPPENVEYRAYTRAREERWVVLHVTFTTDRQGNPLGATVIGHDITHRKQTEEELRGALENLHLMVQAAPKPIMVVNGEGIIEAVNEVGARLMGFQEHELRGSHVQKFTLPFSRMEMDLRLGELRRLAPLPISAVLRVKTGNGTTQWMSVEASLLKAEFRQEKYLIRFEKLDLGGRPQSG
ncbi:MAG TPA: PAS domain S-box protein [Bacteroidota bacterium]